MLSLLREVLIDHAHLRTDQLTSLDIVFAVDLLLKRGVLTVKDLETVKRFLCGCRYNKKRLQRAISLIGSVLDLYDDRFIEPHLGKYKPIKNRILTILSQYERLDS